ncbi:unnamed protein product [Amoebophrya sp. A25]|nr:unnamed protein product [Amoebophrya sp. A25]|eukprot:GSA25T00016119001.1
MFSEATKNYFGTPSELPPQFRACLEAASGASATGLANVGTSSAGSFLNNVVVDAKATTGDGPHARAGKERASSRVHTYHDLGVVFQMADQTETADPTRSPGVLDPGGNVPEGLLLATQLHKGAHSENSQLAASSRSTGLRVVIPKEVGTRTPERVSTPPPTPAFVDWAVSMRGGQRRPIAQEEGLQTLRTTLVRESCQEAAGQEQSAACLRPQEDSGVEQLAPEHPTTVDTPDITIGGQGDQEMTAIPAMCPNKANWLAWIRQNSFSGSEAGSDCDTTHPATPSTFKGFAANSSDLVPTLEQQKAATEEASKRLQRSLSVRRGSRDSASGISTAAASQHGEAQHVCKEQHEQAPQDQDGLPRRDSDHGQQHGFSSFTHSRSTSPTPTARVVSYDKFHVSENNLFVKIQNQTNSGSQAMGSTDVNRRAAMSCGSRTPTAPVVPPSSAATYSYVCVTINSPPFIAASGSPGPRTDPSIIKRAEAGRVLNNSPTPLSGSPQYEAPSTHHFMQTPNPSVPCHTATRTAMNQNLGSLQRNSQGSSNSINSLAASVHRQYTGSAHSSSDKTDTAVSGLGGSTTMAERPSGFVSVPGRVPLRPGKQIISLATLV